MQYITKLAVTLSLVLATVAQEYSGGDTSGCGKEQTINGTTVLRQLSSGDVDRSYYIHLPAGYNKDTVYATILGFHGPDQNGTALEADSQLSDPYYSTRNVVVYPNSLGGSWAGANTSETTVAEDLQFVWDVLADVRSNFCVDSARIYATGMSSGGGFVNTIACNDTVGAEFAAFAPMSGSFYTDNDENFEQCTPARVPMPVIAIHGGADTVVPYDGGEGPGGAVPSVTNWINRWAERNQCDEPDHDDINGDKVHYDVWNCNDIFTALQLYKNDEQAHCWAATGGPCGNIESLIEGTAVFTDNFLRFFRPAE